MDVQAGKGLSRLAKGSVVGMAVNLHNNLWNTNYPKWYPFLAGDESSSFRFEVELG